MADVSQVGSAGEMKRHASLLKRLEQLPAAGDGPVIGCGSAGGESLQSCHDALHESLVVPVLVLQRVKWLAASGGNFFGKLNHLVDRLPSGESHHEGLNVVAQFFGGFRSPGLLQNFDHHGDHDVGPTFADERKRAVEIEQHGAKMAAGDIGMDEFNLVMKEHGMSR